MDLSDLKHKSKKDLNELLMEKRNKLRELYFQASEKQLKNVKAIKAVKADIAQILTVLNSLTRNS